MTKKLATCSVLAITSLFAFQALASVTLSNKDSREYKILIASSDSCFSGTHTSIGSNTTTTVDAGYLCINEEKPAYKLEDGKRYVIKDGKVEQE
jgi:hypothetical protein